MIPSQVNIARRQMEAVRRLCKERWTTPWHLFLCSVYINFAFLFVPASTRALGQSTPETPTIYVNSLLTLVDVIAENRVPPGGLEVLSELKRNDFQIFDNGHEVPIESFDKGGGTGARPIALWLIVQCPDNQSVEKHSMFMRGHTQFLKAGLEHLAAQDVVGVAHWCDSGQAVLDLLPGHDIDDALAKIEMILNEKPVEATIRPGELVMQRLIRTILSSTQKQKTPRLPVYLFLHGDGAATNIDEANSISIDLFQNSGIVYGLNDGRWSVNPDSVRPIDGSDPRAQRVFFLIHYYSNETGGQVYSIADPRYYSTAVEYTLAQLHLRYAIGFRPTKPDGKKHSLKVKLTREASRRFPGAELRFKSEYMPRAVSNP